MRWRIDPSRPLPTLYSKYRGTGFPLRNKNRRLLSPWRDLSPSMKLQVATLVLAEGSFIQFTVHLHDDRREELEAQGADLRKYILDRVTRRLGALSLGDAGEPKAYRHWVAHNIRDVLLNAFATKPRIGRIPQIKNACVCVVHVTQTFQPDYGSGDMANAIGASSGYV